MSEDVICFYQKIQVKQVKVIEVYMTREEVIEKLKTLDQEPLSSEKLESMTNVRLGERLCLLSDPEKKGVFDLSNLEGEIKTPFRESKDFGNVHIFGKDEL